jgi:hypothetical protein
MPDINVKSFNELVESLEKIADGVHLHSSEEGFPGAIKEEDLRTKRTNLEDLRSNYEQTLTKARQLQDQYRELEKATDSDVSRYKTMIYGFYGKKNQVVSDFGMKPFKDASIARKNNSASKKTAVA